MHEQCELRKQKTAVTILFLREVFWGSGPLITDVATHLCLPLFHVHTQFLKKDNVCDKLQCMNIYCALLYILSKQYTA